jgi:cytochrome c biogenesis protein CcdA
MWGLIKDFLTTESAQWYETLPFVVGFLFVIVEIVVRVTRARRPHFSVPALGYMLSEGITVCIVPIYGFALAFDRTLAAAIADKNSKVLAVAMFVAFGTLMIHMFNRWFSNSDSPHPE